jgi:hypothetical protein
MIWYLINNSVLSQLHPHQSIVLILLSHFPNVVRLKIFKSGNCPLPPYGCNLDWSKCSPIGRRYFYSFSITSPRTARIWKNQNPHCQGCVSSHPSWIPTVQCYLLHLYRQSQQGDAIEIEQPDRSSDRIEAVAGHLSLYMSNVFGDIWPLYWHSEELRNC